MGQAGRFLDPIGLFGFNDKSLGGEQNRLKEDSQNAVNDYMGNVTNANNEMQSNVTQAGNDYLKGINSQTDQYSQNTKGIVGENGYRNGLKLAQQGAVDSAGQAAAAAQGAARSAGMSKGAAAILGGGSTVNAYNQGLQNQQNMVQTNFNNQLGVENNKYNTGVAALGNRYSTDANMYGQKAANITNAFGQNIANKQNQENINYNNKDPLNKILTSAGGSITSDCNGKCDIEKVDEIINKHNRKLSNLKINLGDK